MCCKINGGKENKRDFILELQRLKKDNVLICEEELTQYTTIQNNETGRNTVNDIKDFVDNNTNSAQLLDRERLKRREFYNYGYLNIDIQNRIFDIYSQYINDYKSKKISLMKLKVAILVLFSLDKNILNLLQNFDYAFQVPKIIVLHNTENTLNDIDKALLPILSSLGFDILFITPTRYCDIEEIFTEDKLNIFNLEKSIMDLGNPFKSIKQQTKKKGFLERLFGNE